MKESKNPMGRLAQLGQQLKAETEKLNSRIRQYEKSLDRMRLGVSVWLDDVIGDAEELRDGGFQLGYTKVRDKWRIAARRVQVRLQGDEQVVEQADDGPVPLSKASRLVRLRSLGSLDDLVEKLTERVEFFLDQLRAGQDETADDTPPAPAEPASDEAEEPKADKPKATKAKAKKAEKPTEKKADKPKAKKGGRAKARSTAKAKKAEKGEPKKK